MALQETLIDHRFGRIMNADIAEYRVPVNADVHDIKVIFVDELDHGNCLGTKGLGEIGIVGVADRSFTRAAEAHWLADPSVLRRRRERHHWEPCETIV